MEGTTPIGKPTIPFMFAYQWKEGMKVPPDSIVAVKGYFYFNEKKEGFNKDNPVTGDSYSKALSGAGVIKHLIKFYK